VAQVFIGYSYNYKTRLDSLLEVLVLCSGMVDWQRRLRSKNSGNPWINGDRCPSQIHTGITI